MIKFKSVFFKIILILLILLIKTLNIVLFLKKLILLNVLNEKKLALYLIPFKAFLALLLLLEFLRKV